MDHIVTRQIKFSELTDLPTTVYKYRAWSSAYHKTILIDQTVFMAKPSSFEDPVDCKLQKNYDIITDHEIYNKYFQSSVENHPNWSVKEHLNFAMHWHDRTPIRDKEHIAAMQRQEALDFNARFGVLSLTANPKNKSMWEKYSENHTGFCVGFDSKKMFQYLGGGGEVQYSETLPTIFPSDDFDTEHFKQVFYKEKKWEFEQEYRTHKFYQYPASDQERSIKLPPDTYTELIFGAQMPDHERLEIREICKKANLNVKYFVETIAENREDITLSKYDPK